MPAERRRTMVGELEARRSLFVSYLRDRVAAEDWHGVQDAGSDLREIDAALEVLRLDPPAARPIRVPSE